MEKVVLLSGSPKAAGNTVQALQECASVIEKEGLAAEVISLAGKDIKSCIGCGKCKELKKCVLNDGLNEIIDQIRDAKGLVFGAPVYFGTARGAIMSAMQRIAMVSYGTDRFLSKKVGGPVVVARRGGHTATLQEMLMFYFINDMIVVGSSYWNMIFGQMPGEIQKDDEGMTTLRNFSKNIAYVIKKITA